MSLSAFTEFCGRLPHATKDIKWGNDLVFSIGGKMFAVFDESGGERFSFKTTPAVFSILIGRPGIKPAPYVARYHWVSLDHPRVLPRKEIEELLRESYHLVSLGLPAKVRRSLGAQQ